MQSKPRALKEMALKFMSITSHDDVNTGLFSVTVLILRRKNRIAYFYLILFERIFLLHINYFFGLISVKFPWYFCKTQVFLEQPRVVSRWNSTDPFYRILLCKCNQIRGTNLNVSKRPKLNAYFFFFVKKKKTKI